MHSERGTIGFNDWMVRQFSNVTLRAAIQSLGPGINRLVIP